MTLKPFKVDDNEGTGGSAGRTNKMVVNLSNKLKNDKSRKLKYVINIEVIKKLIFLTLDAKKAFNYLK